MERNVPAGMGADGRCKGQKTVPEEDMPAVEFALKEVRRLIAEKTTRRV